MYIFLYLHDVFHAYNAKDYEWKQKITKIVYDRVMNINLWLFTQPKVAQNVAMCMSLTVSASFDASQTKKSKLKSNVSQNR